jgi:hypothetical protein
LAKCADSAPHVEYPRSIIVEAFGHLIALFETEFILDTPGHAA